MEELKNICIGILEGGISEEREISFLSGEQVYYSLKKANINSVRLDIYTDDEEIVRKMIQESRIDVAFVALHGRFGEDGQIQKILEDLNIPYTGSDPHASFLAMNKIASKRIFLEKNIPTPPFYFLENKKKVKINFKFPVVVKPYFSGSSIGVSIVRREEELEKALEGAFRWSEKVIVEKYIEGRELTVGILEEKALGVVEIKYKDDFFNFHTKYGEEKTQIFAPAQLEESVYKKVQMIALSAHKALGCRDFSRVDIRLDKNGNPFVLEVNSIPGLTSHSLLPLSAKCCGISFDELIKRMIMLALGRKVLAFNQ